MRHENHRPLMKKKKRMEEEMSDMNGEEMEEEMPKMSPKNERMIMDKMRSNAPTNIGKQDVILRVDEEKGKKFQEAIRKQTELPEWLKKMLKKLKLSKG